MTASIEPFVAVRDQECRLCGAVIDSGDWGYLILANHGTEAEPDYRKIVWCGCEGDG